MKFIVINGPNLNMLGVREKEIYGSKGYDYLCNYVFKEAEKRKVSVDIFQSNCEGDLIDFIQKAYFEQFDGIVINPGAYTHYSYAIYDAIKGIYIPAVEVHISDIFNRESFRKTSVIAPACIDQISGCGFESYTKAIDVLIKITKESLIEGK